MAKEIDAFCEGIGGRVHVETVTRTNGFQWVPGFEPASDLLSSGGSGEAVKHNYEADNRHAAGVILADPKKRGGAQAGLVIRALSIVDRQVWLNRHSLVSECRNRPRLFQEAAA